MDPVILTWWTFMAVVLVAGSAHSWWWPAARRERLVRDYAARRSLVLDAEAARSAERLLVAAQKGRYAAAVVTAVLASGASAGIGVVDSRLWSGFVVVVLVGTQVAGAAGAALAMHRAGRSLSTRPRAAHLRAFGLDAFLPPVLRWWSAATLAVSTVAVAAALVARPADPTLQGSGLLVAWTSGLGVVVATEVAAQVLVRTPQHAASPAALAVRDEIKSDLLCVVGAGAVGPTLVTIAVTADFLPEAGLPTALAMILPVALLEPRRRRRVRERLWSTRPAAGVQPPVAP